MRNKKIRQSVLLGLAMEMAVCSGVMAEEIGPITGNCGENFDSLIIVRNDREKDGAIQLEGKDDNSVSLTTTEGAESHIKLESAGGGIKITKQGDETKEVHLNSSADNIIAFGNKGDGNGIKAKNTGQSETGIIISLRAAGNNIIESAKTGGDDGIHIEDGKAEVTLTAGSDNTIKAAKGDGISTQNDSKDHTASIADITLSAGWNGKELVTGQGSNTITALSENGISHEGEGTITLEAGQDNVIDAGKAGISSTHDNGKVSLAAKGSNTIYAGKVKQDGYLYGEKNAIFASSGTEVQIESAVQNQLYGAVYAAGKGSLVSLNGLNGVQTNNMIYSAAVISGAGDLEGKKVISALYAEGGAEITVSGQNNEFRTTADPEDKKQLERVIWAYDGADIHISGTTVISTDHYEKSTNSNDIAIAAGTAVGLNSKEDVRDDLMDEEKAHVTLNYGAGSTITGDIIAGYAGKIDVAEAENSDAKINITGNLLAGNNGILNVDLGNGGTLTGRADDYGDAVLRADNHEYTESFRHPAFSSDIYKGGAVNLTMGAGSTWNVTGQSWITRINTEKAETVENVLNNENPINAMKDMATIDLVQANTAKDSFAHALTIYEMNGDAVFNMSLDGDRTVSDMLYMKKADGNYIINVVDAVTTADIYADDFNGLRFATVGAGSDASFRAVTIGGGVLNVEYEVGTDSYDTSTENDAYNSANGSGTGNSEKPGDAMVDNFFGSTGTPVDELKKSDSSESEIKVFSAADAEQDNQAGTQTGAVNYKLIGRKDEQVSHAGQTVIDMSKVNYSNAVYMDRLNKRMGEARYLEGDDGLWVRLRHDRIGKDNAFRSMNTMMELGYDRKVQSQKDGEHRRGVAFDYMRGSADYTNVMGSGDVRRAGVWLYDTWLGDKGHYSDYVVKYGRLSNEFNIFNELGTEVSGDYDNDVWSVSAEYGRKKDIGNEWYFEPQAQMQYAYVTSADYTTSQGSRIELDGIDSLIGRAGFRLGRDTSEGNTVYFKADILHEFLGDQDIHAMDTTTNGVLTTTYENEGTWYDVGFGFSHRMGKDSYMFLDLEHSFGNDNEDTYQINIGLSKAF